MRWLLVLLAGILLIAGLAVHSKYAQLKEESQISHFNRIAVTILLASEQLSGLEKSGG